MNNSIQNMVYTCLASINLLNVLPTKPIFLCVLGKNKTKKTENIFVGGTFFGQARK